MKFKVAFQHRGLCEVETIDATYEDYRKKGELLTKERGLDTEPDFFIKQRDKWWKLDELGEICGVELCTADYTGEIQDDG